MGAYRTMKSTALRAHDSWSRGALDSGQLSSYKEANRKIAAHRFNDLPHPRLTTVYRGRRFALGIVTHDGRRDLQIVFFRSTRASDLFENSVQIPTLIA